MSNRKLPQNINNAFMLLRDTINKSIHIRNQIFQNKEDEWDRLWSAFDSIDDAQLAINDYARLSTVRYLELYGLMQAFYIQQDAIDHIGQVTTGKEKINWYTDEIKLSEIRSLRNRIAGHPAHIKEPNIIYRANIVRSSITKTSFKYILWSNGKAVFHEVNIKQIIQEQEEGLLSLSNNLTLEIEKIEKDFMMQFDGKTVKKIFDKVSYYHFEKIYGYSNLELAEAMLESFEDVFREVKAAMEERYGIFETTINAPGLKESVDDITELSRRIKESLQGRISDEFGHRIYVDALQSEWQVLGRMVDETDQKFAQK